MADEETPKMSREDAILERMAGRNVEIPGEDDTATDGDEARENLSALADEQAEAGEGHGGQTAPDGSSPTLGADAVDEDLDLSEDAGSATEGGDGSDVTPGQTPEEVGVAAAKQTGAANGEAPPEGEADAVADAAADREDGTAPDDVAGDDEDAAGDGGAGDEEE